MRTLGSKAGAGKHSASSAQASRPSEACQTGAAGGRRSHGREKDAPDALFKRGHILSLRLRVRRNDKVEVVRAKGRRHSLFMLTRAVVGVVALVLCLVSTGSTFAYLDYTTNTAVNRTTSGNVLANIVENGEQLQGNATATLGKDGKQVAIISPPDDANRTDELVRVTFVPQVESKDTAGANILMDENWTAPVRNADGEWVLEGELLTLYLDSAWQDSWTYADGTFYYNKVLEPGQTTPLLLKGADMASGKSKDDYASVKVNVIADALQAYPADAAATWGCTVASDGTVTKTTA